MELKKLSEPFSAEDIEWRAQSTGESNGKFWVMCLAYVTARAIMDRLDEVCGPGRWCNEFKAGPDGGVICGLSIKIDDEWVTKWDGADKTNIEAIKGGLSGATKRAGVQWGIGRYLYKLDAAWGTVTDKGKHSAKTKDNKWFKWDAPKLPPWALPENAAPLPKKKAPKKKPSPKKSKRYADYVADIDTMDGVQAINDWLMANWGQVKIDLSELEAGKFKEYAKSIRKVFEA